MPVSTVEEQLFLCPESGIYNNPAVSILVPKVCCGIRLRLGPSVSLYSTFLTGCEYHSVTYAQVWENYHIKKIHHVQEAPTMKTAQRTRKDPDGETCSRCHNFSPFAESNMPDGSFCCFSCRF